MMTPEDHIYEQALKELHNEEIMRLATISQCIYVFVEGESEKVAIPILLERWGLDLEKEGIVIANYNGINNLPHILRLLSLTLSYDRPIIVTYDNDLDGQRIERKITTYLNSNSKISLQKIPDSPVVCFKNKHTGGSFEEAFDVKHFVNTCFQDIFMPSNIASRKAEFVSQFISSEPWLSQICQFCKKHSYVDFGSCKVKLAEELANTSEPIPSTFNVLSKLITKVRLDNPVKNPNQVELPRIHGLTC